MCEWGARAFNRSTSRCASEPIAPRLLEKQQGKPVAILLLNGKEKRREIAGGA
jgi:hypothetical protein